MCKLASYLWKKSEAMGVEIKIWDIVSHGNTQEHLKLTEKAGWYEGHYLPNGTIECRVLDGVSQDASDEIKRRYPTFMDFLNWCFTQNVEGNLDVGGFLDLGGCNLAGIKLPESVGGDLDLRGCKNIPKKLPTVKGTIYK